LSRETLNRLLMQPVLLVMTEFKNNPKAILYLIALLTVLPSRGKDGFIRALLPVL
jgi:hypothetical protein